MDSSYDGNGGNPEHVTEEELDNNPMYFTQLVVVEYFGTDPESLSEEGGLVNSDFSETDPEDLLDADDSGLLNQFEDAPEKVAQDFRRLHETASQGELPEQYEEHFAGAIAKTITENRMTIYDVAGIQNDFKDEFEEVKKEHQKKLWY